MSKLGKKMKVVKSKVEPRPYGLKEAVDLVKRTAYAKFDESVDVAIRLGVDPKRSDQMVRGTTVRRRSSPCSALWSEPGRQKE